MELPHPLGLAPGQEPMGPGGSFTVGRNARTVYTLLVSPLKIPEQEFEFLRIEGLYDVILWYFSGSQLFLELPAHSHLQWLIIRQ